jgi:GT2 family glycosyltransferase
MLTMSTSDLDGSLRCSIIVSTYNDGHRACEAVDSLLAQTEQSFEVIVIDDGSTNDTAARLTVYQNNPKVRLLSLDKNQGVPRARNHGIKAAQGEIIVFMDADAIAPKYWLKALLQPFTRAGVACVGGPDVAPPDDTLFALCIDYTLQSVIATGGLRRKGQLARYSPAGCNMAIRADILHRIGLFDERLARRGEEKELIQRIRRQGSEIAYAPDALVMHHRRTSVKSFWKQVYLSGRARVDILRIAPDALEPAHLFPAVVTLMLLTAALGALLRPGEPLFVLPLVLYGILILCNGFLGGLQHRSPKAAWYISLTSAMIHLGYGLGFWIRLAELSVSEIVRSRQSPHTS